MTTRLACRWVWLIGVVAFLPGLFSDLAWMAGLLIMTVMAGASDLFGWKDEA